MNGYLLALRHTPTILERILDDVPASRYTDRCAEDRFTLIEAIAHMADFENIFLDRMTAAFENDGVEVADVDEVQRAIDKHYADRDLHKELEVFANRRRDTITFLEERTPEELQQAFTKAGLGRVTIAEYTAMLAGHDLYHIEQASWYLKGLHGKE